MRSIELVNSEPSTTAYFCIVESLMLILVQFLYLFPLTNIFTVRLLVRIIIAPLVEPDREGMMELQCHRGKEPR